MNYLSNFILERPWLVVLLYGALAGAGAISALLWLDLNTDTNALVSPAQDYNQRYHRYRETFGDQEYMYVVVEIDDLEIAMEVADVISEEVAPLVEAGLVKECIHRVAIENMLDGVLLYLPPSSLEKMAAQVRTNRDALNALVKLDTIAELLAFLPDHFDTGLAREHGAASRIGFEILRDGLLFLERVSGSDSPTSTPFDLESYALGLYQRGALQNLEGDRQSRLVAQALTRGYLVGGDLLLVMIMPRKNDQTLQVIREPLRAVRSALDRVRERFPQVRLGLTGRPVLQADQMETSNRDMTRAAILAIVGVLCLFILFFRNVRRPVLTIVVLLHAIAITFGILTLTVGYLNLLSIVFAVMMVSVGTEFGIHVIARYQEELEKRSIAEAIRTTVTATGRANLTGAATTAAAFYTTMFAGFRGLAELGFIAGTGVLVCMIAMNTLLPALLFIVDRWRAPRGRLGPLRFGLLGHTAMHPWRGLGTFAILLVALVPFQRELAFDSNLLELQADGLGSVEYEKKIIDNRGMKTWYAVFLVESRERVQSVVSQLSDERYSEIIGHVESVLDYVPSDQEQKRGILETIAGEIESPPGSETTWPAVPTTLDVPGLEDSIARFLEWLDTLLSGASVTQNSRPAAGIELLEELIEITEGLSQNLAEYPERSARNLGSVQVGLFAELRRWFRRAIQLLNPGPLDLDGLDPTVRRRVASETGEFLIYAYPRRNIWKEENLRDFVTVTHEIDPEVTGLPEQIYQSTRIMKKSFLLAAMYSLIGVSALLLFDFRSLLLTALAILPVIVGIVMTIMVMPVLGIAFNLANFFAIPIVIGDGVNGGVHMIHRYTEESSPFVARGSTGTAVLLSSLTTITGFGMLLLASHRGVASLGALMVIGSVASLFGSLAVLPALLSYLTPGQRANELAKRGES